MARNAQPWPKCDLQITTSCDLSDCLTASSRAAIITLADWERIPEAAWEPNLSMPILWLRVALGCYAVGLLYALVALTRTSDLLNNIALHAAYLGMVFHFVSLTDSFLLSGQITLTSVQNAESVLGFLVMVVFMLVYLVYHTTSPGIVVFPLVFLLTFLSATSQPPFLIHLAGSAYWMVVRAHRADLHRLCRAHFEFRRQPALSDSRTLVEGQEARKIPLPACQHSKSSTKSAFARCFSDFRL